jgi:hypothetical protein
VPVYQVPENSQLNVAPPLQQHCNATEIYKLGKVRPCSAPSHTPGFPSQHIGPWLTHKDPHRSCYIKQAQHHMVANLWSGQPVPGRLPCPERESCATTIGLNDDGTAHVLGATQLLQRKLWMQLWLEGRGGVGPVAAQDLSSREESVATAAKRLRSVRARRVASARALSETRALFESRRVEVSKMRTT